MIRKSVCTQHVIRATTCTCWRERHARQSTLAGYPAPSDRYWFVSSSRQRFKDLCGEGNDWTILFQCRHGQKALDPFLHLVKLDTVEHRSQPTKPNILYDEQFIPQRLFKKGRSICPKCISENCFILPGRWRSSLPDRCCHAECGEVHPADCS